ncbi:MULTISPECIES: MBL fold metallo-hydrolase [Thalassospira]|uniref:MBL fold metallo-hydrolase n=1 Tax=Thalassospira aquimaris TaxID=3037796 RepID=A0ABT6GE44_9PROT|nr:MULTISPECIES: MBL fold metallo-hydrolase [Thalassospira]MDG4720259.1 MBL fold metallo-hydrolase [Thalassospira sp. FZY0004]
MNRRDFMRSGLGGIAAAATIAHSVNAANATAGTDTPALEISWLGAATMLIAFDGFTILTDPIFGEGKETYFMADPNAMFDLKTGPTARYHARTTVFPGIDLSSIDLMMLSHLHEDHFDQKAEATLPKTLPTIVPSADAAKLASKGFSNQTPLDWGDSKSITTPNGKITLTAIPAHHSVNPQVNAMLGKGNGYWLRFESGNWQKDVYWTGDTFATDTVMNAVRNIGRPDIVIPHMGAVGTTGPLGLISMGAEQVLDLSAKLDHPNILPIHHSTLPLYLEPVSRLIEQADFARNRIDLIAEGSTIRYS